METSIPYKGCTIEIEQDPDPMNPRTEWDNLGNMICCHKRYVLGNKHSYKHSDYSSWDEFINAIEKNEGPIVWLPIYMYDHSGISISTNNNHYPFNDQWDAGKVGFIYVDSKKGIK